MGGGVASSISPSVGEDAVISEYAQYLFSEALAQASISDGSTIKAEEMNCSAKIYFKEGCMFQCTSNTKGWYNHDLHWKYNPTHYSIKLEESTHRAQERSQRSLCSMHSEANKSRQVWGWGYLDVFGYFFLHTLESQTSCRGIVWCLEEIDVHSISTGCLTSPWANEWNTIVGHWED